MYDSRYPKYKWQLGLILEPITSSDGEIRRCKIKIGDVESERTVEQLFSLELNAEEYAEAVKVKMQKEKEEKLKKMRKGLIDPEIENEMQNDRPIRQMAINARNKVRELYKKDLV